MPKAYAAVASPLVDTSHQDAEDYAAEKLRDEHLFEIILKIDPSRVDHTSHGLVLRVPGRTLRFSERDITEPLEREGLPVEEAEDIALKMIDVMQVELRLLALRKLIR